MENVQLMLFRIVLAIMSLVGVIWLIPFVLIGIPLSFLDNGVLSWQMVMIGFKPLLIIVNFVRQTDITAEDFFEQYQQML